MENKAQRVSDEQVASWKQQHKIDVVYEITVPLDDDGNNKVVGYFRKPSLQTIQASEKFAGTDPIKSGIVMFDNCYIGGDQFNDEAKMSAITELGNLFKIRAAEVKNL